MFVSEGSESQRESRLQRSASSSIRYFLRRPRAVNHPDLRVSPQSESRLGARPLLTRITGIHVGVQLGPCPPKSATHGARARRCMTKPHASRAHAAAPPPLRRRSAGPGRPAARRGSPECGVPSGPAGRTGPGTRARLRPGTDGPGPDLRAWTQTARPSAAAGRSAGPPGFKSGSPSRAVAAIHRTVRVGQSGGGGGGPASAAGRDRGGWARPGPYPVCGPGKPSRAGAGDPR